MLRIPEFTAPIRALYLSLRLRDVLARPRELAQLRKKWRCSPSCSATPTTDPCSDGTDRVVPGIAVCVQARLAADVRIQAFRKMRRTNHRVEGYVMNRLPHLALARPERRLAGLKLVFAKVALDLPFPEVGFLLAMLVKRAEDAPPHRQDVTKGRKRR